MCTFDWLSGFLTWPSLQFSSDYIFTFFPVVFKNDDTTLVSAFKVAYIAGVSHGVIQYINLSFQTLNMSK